MINNRWAKSLLYAMLSGGAFLVAILLIYFVRYAELMDVKLFIPFYLIILIIGLLAVVFAYKRFCIILYAGAVIGLIVDCITTYQEAGHTTMAGGLYNFLITSLFFIIGIIVQVVHGQKKKRNIV